MLPVSSEHLFQCVLFPLLGTGIGSVQCCLILVVETFSVGSWMKNLKIYWLNYSIGVVSSLINQSQYSMMGVCTRDGSFMRSLIW